MSGHVIPWDTERAAAMNTHAAVQLLSLLCLPDEEVFLQTIAEGPREMYSWRKYTRKDGSEAEYPTYRVKLQNGHVVTGNATERGRVFTLKEILKSPPFQHANMAHAGVFFTVNALEVGAEKRTADNVRRVRAVLLDLDGSPLPENFPLEPTAIVESSPGKFHVYWVADGVTLEEFTVVQRHLAALYNADPSVSDLPRIMRLPGYWHSKKAPGFVSRIVQTKELRYTRSDLLDAFEGLQAALNTAKDEEAARLAAAEKQRERAAQLREELDAGTVSDRAQVQRKHGQAALLSELAKLTTTGQGGRNSQLFKSAAALGELIAAGSLERAEVVSDLTAAALAIGLGDHEVRGTLESGLRKGMKNPRDLTNVGARVNTAPTNAGQQPTKPDPVVKVGIRARTSISAHELLGMHFDQVQYLVPGLIPAEGLIPFAGPPKLGKSWLTLNLAIAVATGGMMLNERITQGDVLYLALEDPLRRLKDRIRQILGHEVPAGLERLTVRTSFPLFDMDGLEEIRKWAQASERPRLVVVDVLRRAYSGKLDFNDYGQTTTALGPLQQMALELNLAIIAVTHTKKSGASDSVDVFERVLGSTAITSVADATLVLARERMQADAVLAVTGRDVEEKELALRWHGPTGTWHAAGSAEEARLSVMQREVLKAVRAGYRQNSQLVEYLGKPKSQISNVLTELVSKGLLTRSQLGKGAIFSEVPKESELNEPSELNEHSELNELFTEGAESRTVHSDPPLNSELSNSVPAQEKTDSSLGSLSSPTSEQIEVIV